jgi:Flagellar protein YcgR/PilZ domain
MPSQAETAPSLRLSDMDLRIGQTVQVITRGPQPRKYYTQLIGYVEREFIMLRTPQEKGWAVPLSEGETLDVRVFCGVSLYEFQSRLQTLLLRPRNFMLLSCPTSVQQTRFRSHERVKCALPVQVMHTHEGQKMGGGFEFQDLSGSGAALVGPQSLGEPGQQLQLQMDFHLAATGTHERFDMMADIQSVQPLLNAQGETTGYHHGIRFADIEPRILLLVNELLRPHAH